MIKLAILLFLVSIVAGLFGFTKLSTGAAGLARTFFYIAVVIFLAILIFGVLLGGQLAF